MLLFFRQNQLCDVTLVADDIEIPAHKMVLASCSPYFYAMFTGFEESRQDRIVIQGVDHQALELFIDEEKAHAHLLEQLVHHFGGGTIKCHWTHALFRIARRALGLNFELQVLVIAELVGTAYYRLLHRRSRDPVLEQACDRILRDETRHVDFHAEWLGDFQWRLLPLERAAWSAQFQVLFTIAAQIAWLDHRFCLEALGAKRREFFREARSECIHFLKQLERSVEEGRAACAARMG